MKRICLVAALIACTAINAIAQNVTVISSLGTPNAPYTTLKAGFDAINAGTHRGIIQIDVQGSFTETSTAVLNRSGTGAASYTSILIQPIAPTTITGTFFSAALVDLNGAENVTIDGRIGGIGSTRSLILQNLSTSNNALTSTIRFRNDAANNIVRYVNIEGSSRGTGTGTVIFTGSTGALGNRQIDIQNNDIRPAGINLPFNAIFSAGQSASILNNNIRITNNLIHDMFNMAGQSIGVFANTNNAAWTVSGNSIYQTATRTNTGNITCYGIVFNSGNGHTATGNFIGGSAAGATGSPLTINGAFVNSFTGVHLSVGATTASNVDGNVITNMNLSTTAAASINQFYGISVLSGLVNIGVNAGNTIGATSGTGAIVCNVSNTSNTWNIGIQTRNSTVNIRNNNIGSITVNGSSSGTNLMRGIECNDNPGLTIMNNIIGGTTAASIQANGPNNAFNGVLIGSSINHNAVISGNTIRNIVNNGVAPNNVIIFGIENSVHTAGINMTTTITNNIIHDFSAPTATPASSILYGIFVRSVATASTDADINANQIYNFSSSSNSTNTQVAGIALIGTYTNFLNINDNQIHSLTAASNYTDPTDGAVQGIVSVGTVPGTLNILRNTIYNLESTGTGPSNHVIGLGAIYAGSAGVVSRNRIYDLRNLNNPATGMISGMYFRGQGSAGTFNVHNNMISITSPNVQVYGIQHNETATQLNLYFNSVFIGGTESGTNSSAPLFRNGAAVGTPVQLRDNLFYNTRTGGAPYALINNHSVPSTGWTASSSNYNVLYNSSSPSVALWGATPLNLADFRTTSGGDLNSRSVVVNFVNTSTGDLHLTGASLGDQNLAGITVPGITEDFDGNTRGAFPYIGSDEYPAAPLPILIEYFTGKKENGSNTLRWKASCEGQFFRFDVERSNDGKNFATIGGITAGATECKQPFVFTDNYSFDGVTYYRLRATDDMGVVSYSRTIAISNSKIRFVLAGTSPTLVRSKVYLSVSASKKTEVDIRIYGVDGRMVYMQRFFADEGSGIFELNLRSLSPGIYQLTAYTSFGHAGTIRFVKQ